MKISLKVMAVAVVLLQLPACSGNQEGGASAQSDQERSTQVAPVQPEAIEGPSTQGSQTGVEEAQAAANESDPVVSRTCEYSFTSELYGSRSVSLRKVCSGLDTGLESCRSFEIIFAKGVSVSHSQLGIRTIDGRLQFNPYNLEFYSEEIGGDAWPRWVLSLVEWGGGKFAAERHVVLSEEGKAESPVLDPSQFSMWRSMRHNPDQALFFEGPKEVASRCSDQPI